LAIQHKLFDEQDGFSTPSFY